MNHNEVKPDETEVMRGGVFLGVTYSNGNTDRVFVRELPVSLMELYQSSLDKEDVCAEMYCTKSVGWGNTLTRESLVEVINKGEELNLPFFAAWFARQRHRQVRLLEIIGGLLPASLKPSESANS
jgi:hypothetical protein